MSRLEFHCIYPEMLSRLITDRFTESSMTLWISWEKSWAWRSTAPQTILYLLSLFTAQELYLAMLFSGIY